jgi:hypothetical protein
VFPEQSCYRAAELLRLVRGHQLAMEQARQIIRDRVAPEFSLFDFIDVDELRLSDILAWLLNPDSNHGQGSRFLHAFLEHIKQKWDVTALAAARVRKEVTTNLLERANRRIDVLVTSPGHVLAIENKPWAADQKQQVADYLAHLDRLCPHNRCLVYLSNGSAPSEDSLDANERELRRAAGQLKELSYSDLIPWLMQCRAVCRADRVSAFIDDFAGFIQRQFSGVRDMTENDRLVDLILKNSEMIGPALQIAACGTALRVKLLSTLADQVEAIVPSHWKVKSDSQASSWAGLSIFFTEMALAGFRIEFQRSGFGFLIFGMKLCSPATESRWIRQALLAHLGHGRNSEYWPWYRAANLTDPFLPLPSDWTSDKPWTDIASGKVASVIVEAATRFEAALSSPQSEVPTS